LTNSWFWFFWIDKFLLDGGLVFRIRTGFFVQDIGFGFSGFGFVYQSTSDTKVGAHTLPYNCRNARFSTYGIY
jgi:hypothetical protein